VLFLKEKVILIISLISLVFISIVLYLFAFKNDSINKSVRKDDVISFEIYLANYDSISEAQKKGLEEIELSSEPIITQEDILKYNWVNHDIRIKPNSLAWKEMNELKVSTAGKPFVVVCNGERIYLGGFWNLISSLNSPNCPLIIGLYPGNINMKDSFKIQYKPVNGKNDTRRDERIYSTLKELSVLE